MPAREGTRPEPAPVALRVAAGGLRVLTGFALMGGASVLLAPVMKNVEARERMLARLEPLTGISPMTTLCQRATARNVPTWPARTLGLCVVDARTGGPISVSSAVRLELFDAGLGWLVKQILARPVADYEHRRAAAEAAARAELAEDRVEPDEVAIRAAVAQRMSEDTTCLASLVTGVVVRTLAPLATIPFTARRQSLGQWFAGVMVVRA
jgi:hypothetical protein